MLRDKKQKCCRVHAKKKVKKTKKLVVAEKVLWQLVVNIFYVFVQCQILNVALQLPLQLIKVHIFIIVFTLGILPW